MAEPNPHPPPATSDVLEPLSVEVGWGADPPTWSFRSVAELFVLLLLAPVAGFLLFGTAHIAYTLAFETYVMPRLLPAASHGLEGLVSCLLVSALGAVAGLLAVVARFPMAWVALVVPPCAAALLGLFAVSWWEMSLAEYGPDPSDYVVFVPMLGASCLVIVLTVVVGMARVRPYLRQIA